MSVGRVLAGEGIDAQNAFGMVSVGPEASQYT
jgi:hypothetical protein